MENKAYTFEIAKKIDIPSLTVKRILSDLLEKNLIEKHGNVPGTNYSILLETG